MKQLRADFRQEKATDCDHWETETKEASFPMPWFYAWKQFQKFRDKKQVLKKILVISQEIIGIWRRLRQLEVIGQSSRKEIHRELQRYAENLCFILDCTCIRWKYTYIHTQESCKRNHSQSSYRLERLSRSDQPGWRVLGHQMAYSIKKPQESILQYFLE